MKRQFIAHSEFRLSGIRSISLVGGKFHTKWYIWSSCANSKAARTHLGFCRNDSNIRREGGEKKQEEFEISNFSPSGHDSGGRCGGRLSKKGEKGAAQDILRFKVGGQKMDEKLLRRKGRRDRKKKERCTINVNRSH